MCQAVEQCGFETELCRANGRHIAAGACAKDEDVEVCVGHLIHLSDQHANWFFEIIAEGGQHLST